MKDKSIFIITRYSVITGGVQIGVGRSADEVKRILFSKERLDCRFALFSKIMAPSLISQKPCNANLHFVILTSDELPVEHREKLDAQLVEIEKKSSFKCTVIPMPAGSSLNKYINSFLDENLVGKMNHAYATVRMDDDDGIASSYCARLCGYLERGIVGFPISFAYGFEGMFDEATEKFSNIRHWYKPKIALGLAFTNKYSNGKYLYPDKNIYSLGNHTRIDIKHPVIIDALAPAFIRTVSAHNDSGAFPYHDSLPKAQQGDVDFNEFPFIRCDLPAEVREDGSFIVAKAASSDAARYKAEVKLLRAKIKN